MDEVKLTASERRRLRDELRRTRDARLHRRLLALQECDRGAAVSEVAELLG